jgi:ATP-binding cassette, subfamily B, bacterial CvaB/MchF/RaxB
VTAARSLDFRGRPRLPAIRQAEAAECGLACLAMIASYHGHEVDLNALRRRFPISLKGVTLKDLMQIAARLNLAGRALRLEPENLRKLRLPAILHWDMNHFVVLGSVGRKQVTIHDPALGVRVLGYAELSGHMTGVALELTPTQGFERLRERERVGILDMVGRVSGLGRALGQALVLSLILQLFVLASPFYMQIAVDEVVVKGDEGLLTALAVGFTLFALINVTASWLRAAVSLQLGNILSLQMVIRLFHHMMRLPLPFFERRHIGDLISRFHSTQPIKDLLTEGLVSVIVDGLMALGTLALMFVYSGRLALVALIAITLYVTLRLILFRPLRSRTDDQIHAQARQDSTFIETVRAIQSIKLFGREAERESVWQNRYAGFVNAGIRVGRLQVGFKAANDFIYALENVATIYLGARLALDGAITIGMLFAFMAYKQQFLDKVARLVEKGIDLRMLDLHLERLGDIALARCERGHDEPLNLGRPLVGAIQLRGVAFRYAEIEPFVFEDLDLRIEPGEFVAITGPSGGGKTTLMKLMVGLFEPTSGEVLIDGFPLHALGLQSLRAQIGVVMQDDHLLSGSIVENIAFFDPATSLSLVEACAEIAGIHADIMRMPMGYNTLIGDMGSTLSGGQRQRVLLARALYRKPRILFLDEGTSHLDPMLEAQVNAALATLAITRVIIAHRPQTVAAASRVLRLEDGRLSGQAAGAPPRGWAADANTATL